jgi:hypothetical protein
MAAVTILGDVGPVVFTNGVIVGEEAGMFVRGSNVRAEGCVIVADQPVDFDGGGDLELVNCRDHFGNSSASEASAAPINYLIHRIVSRHLG